jgi:hypothetical protein
MTPTEYKALYDGLRIFRADGHSVTISIRRYRMAGTGGMPGGRAATAWTALSSALTTKFGAHPPYKKIEDVDLMVGTAHDLEQVDPDFTATKDFRYLLLLPFVGKGAPEHCQLVLQLIQYLGLETDPQKYADNNLGLDCNGWTGNYIRHGLGSANWQDHGINGKGINPETLVKDFLDGNQARRVKNWTDMAPGTRYVLVRTNDHGQVITTNTGSDIGHVLITDIAAGTISATTPIHIVEATGTHKPPKDNTRDFGGGLVTSDYKLVQELNKGKNNAFFKIDRGGTDYWAHSVLYFAIAGISPAPQAGG